MSTSEFLVSSLVLCTNEFRPKGSSLPRRFMSLSEEAEEGWPCEGLDRLIGRDLFPEAAEDWSLCLFFDWL